MNYKAAKSAQLRLITTPIFMRLPLEVEEGGQPHGQRSSSILYELQSHEKHTAENRHSPYLHVIAS